MTDKRIHPSNDPEQAFSLDNGKYYFAIQESDCCYDYTIFNSDFSEYDGGQLDEPDIPISEALELVLEMFGLDTLTREQYDYEELQTQVDKHDMMLFFKLQQAQPLKDQIMNAQDKTLLSQTSNRASDLKRDRGE